MTAPDLTRCVDAAARAWHDRWQQQRRDDGRLRPDGKPWAFDDLNATDQHALRSFVLPIVTAVVDTITEDQALEGAPRHVPPADEESAE